MKEWTIVDHWTGGGHIATAKDLEHYNSVVQGDATVVLGHNSPEDQSSTADGIYGAHTRAFNTKCIGVAVACMAGAQEGAEPPNYGSSAPMTREQFLQMCHVNARYCIEYGIPVTRETVLLHSEVQPNLGIWQRGKWDINVLPWDDSIVGFRAVGDYMREQTSAAIAKIQNSEGTDVIIPKTPPQSAVILRYGSTGPAVGALQRDLAALGYYEGLIDDDFRGGTEGAVESFQRDQGILVDGWVGNETRRHLSAAMVARRDVRTPAARAPTNGAAMFPPAVMNLMEEAKSEGSKTLWWSQIERAIGAFGTPTALLSAVDRFLSGADPVVIAALIVAAAIGAVVWYIGERNRKSRLEKGKKADIAEAQVMAMMGGQL